MQCQIVNFSASEIGNETLEPVSSLVVLATSVVRAAHPAKILANSGDSVNYC